MSSKGTILVVDDDPIFRAATEKVLSQEGYTVFTATGGREGLTIVGEKNIDLVLSDLFMEEMNGLEFLMQLKRLDQNLEVMMITGQASLDTAIVAMRSGAADYIQKPWDQKNKELQVRIEKVLEKRNTVLDRNRLKRELLEKYDFKNLIGDAPCMKCIFDLMEKVINNDVTVLLLGETGTGKEVVAKSIHYHSNRKDKPFVVVNCPAYSESLLESELFGHEKGAFTGAVKEKIGRFEMASEGTVFIDEIGELNLSIQAKLLRFLQEKEFERVGGSSVIHSNARIIAATHKDLKSMVAEGKFREDLYYRLNVFPIDLPPLRDRKDDIALLSKCFIDQANHRFQKNVSQISMDALQTLMSYHWPGNVRELQHIIERAVLLETTSILSHIILPSAENKPHAEKASGKLSQEKRFPKYSEYIDPRMASMEKEYFQELLQYTRGNISDSAQQSGLNRNTVMRKMSQYGISKDSYKLAKE